jgi:hypothetical protein
MYKPIATAQKPKPQSRDPAYSILQRSRPTNPETVQSRKPPAYPASRNNSKKSQENRPSSSRLTSNVYQPTSKSGSTLNKYSKGKS